MFMSVVKWCPLTCVQQTPAPPTHTHKQMKDQNAFHPPCVEQSIQTKIIPNPYTNQVCKVMDAAQGWGSVICAERVRDFPLLTSNSHKKANKRCIEKKTKTTKNNAVSHLTEPWGSWAPYSHSASLNSHSEWGIWWWESSERGSKPASQSAQLSSQSGKEKRRRKTVWVKKLNKWMSS